MISGFDTAFGEITLVLFTTLAPSGSVAVGIIAALLLACGGHLPNDVRARVDKWLCIPIVVSMMGLVASATHLGNPANALYVFMSIGRSPLSTEVFCAVVFLLFAGVYWLYSFSQRPRRGLQCALLLFQVLTAAVFVTAVAFAYSAETIESWNTVYVPLNLWLNALVGGPALALLALQVAQWDPAPGRFGRIAISLAAAMLAANVVSYAVQGLELAKMENSMVRAVDLVPGWWPMLVVFALFATVGLVLSARAWRVANEGPLATGDHRALLFAVGGNVLVFAGIFIMRFAFYMMHMTVGLGV